MPSKSFSLAPFSLTSERKATYNEGKTKTFELDVSDVMSGSTVDSATASLYTDGNGVWEMRFGTANFTNINNVRQGDYNITSIFPTPITESKISVTFRFTGYRTSAGSDTGSLHGYPSGNIGITVNYTLPYTACTAPTSVVAASTNVAPGATVRLSWSGASGGINNAIASYTVFRSTDGSNWAELQSGVTNAYLDVSAPTTNNAVYYYAVQSIGTVSGYSSSRSTAMAQIKCVFSAPSVSAVKIDNSTSTVYKKAGTTAVLSWTGTNGTNNAITKYQVYRGTTLLSEPSTNSLTVDAPAAGGQYSYSIIPVGAYSSGSAVTSPTMYGYSDPSAPTAVTLSKTEAGKAEAVTLSWSGASAGTGNPITGYKVYRSTSLNGSYTQQGSVITTTSTTVNAPSSNGSYYYYKIVTVGAYSESAQSTEYVRLRAVWSTPSVSAISLSSPVVAPSSDSVLQFTVAAGTNNPVASIEVYQGDTKIATVDANVTTYNVTSGSTAGDELSFKVKPIGVETDPASSFSSEVVLKSYGPVTAPSTVSVSSATPDAGTSVTLSWSGASAGAFNSIVSYEVYRASSASGSYTLLTTVTGTSLSVPAPANMGASYYYKIKTVGQYTTSGFSSYAQVTAQTYTVPAAPVIMLDPTSATIYDDNPVLSWNAAAAGTNNPVTGYRVYRATSETGTYTQLGSDLAPNVLSLSVEVNPTNGASYFYKVYTLGTKSGYTLSAPSNIAQLITSSVFKCGIPPDFHANTNLINSGESFVLSWGASTPGANNSVKQYALWRDNGSGWALRGIVMPGESNLFLEFAGSAGTVQRYRVKAESDVSVTFDSDWSEIVTVVSNSPPGNILRIVEQPLKIFETNPITISWIQPVDPDGNLYRYEIDIRTREPDGDAWGLWSEWEHFTYVTTPRASLLPSLARGNQCQFRIRAVDTLGLTDQWVLTSSYTRDVIPDAPVVVLPSDNATTYDAMPYMIVSADLAPTNNTKTLEMSIDNGEWQQITPIGRVTQGYAVRSPAEISDGILHYFRLRVKDRLGVVSSAVSVHIRRNTISWEREITRGTIISKAGSMFIDDDLMVLYGSYSGDALTVDNGEWDDDRLVIGGDGGISHQEEVAQMYMYVNTGLSYYNLATVPVPAAVGEDYEHASSNNIGMFAAWGSQMSALYTALKRIYTLLGLTAPAVSITSGMMPTAAVINTIRTMIENM